MLIWFLAANFALTVLYVAIRRKRREGLGLAPFFLFVPGLGFLVYYLPGLLQRFLEQVGVDWEAVLINAMEIERQPEHPDVQQALDVVPIEDAMAVSGNTEKRALLLGQLKKDLKENYKTLLAAEQDEDSESAHYVAAAKMEIYRLQQTRWLECRREYEKDPGDPEKYHTACAVLTEMLSSGVLSPREQNAYRRCFCGLVQERLEAGENEVSLKEYEEYLSCLIALGQYADAERFWQAHAEQMRSEISYQNMLKMFYQTGERQKFEEILSDLRRNRQIRLSAKGLERRKPAGALRPLPGMGGTLY